MKKQFKKLNLNKRTISNLDTPEMTKIVGGGPTNGNHCTINSGVTCHGGTCNGSCNLSHGPTRCD